MRSIPLSRKEPIKVALTCNSRLQKWAFDNAWMLIFVFSLFVIEMIGLFILGVYVHAKG